MPKTIMLNTLRTIVTKIPIKQVLSNMSNHFGRYFITVCTRTLAKLPVANVRATTITQ